MNVQDAGSRRTGAAKEMPIYLYRVEAEMKDGSLLTVVLAASTETEALERAGNHLLRHTVVTPAVVSLSLVEKKPLRKGTGFVIPTVQDV